MKARNGPVGRLVSREMNFYGKISTRRTCKMSNIRKLPKSKNLIFFHPPCLFIDIINPITEFSLHHLRMKVTINKNIKEVKESPFNYMREATWINFLLSFLIFSISPFNSINILKLVSAIREGEGVNKVNDFIVMKRRFVSVF